MLLTEGPGRPGKPLSPRCPGRPTIPRWPPRPWGPEGPRGPWEERQEIQLKWGECIVINSQFHMCHLCHNSINSQFIGLQQHFITILFVANQPTKTESLSIIFCRQIHGIQLGWAGYLMYCVFMWCVFVSCSFLHCFLFLQRSLIYLFCHLLRFHNSQLQLRVRASLSFKTSQVYICTTSVRSASVTPEPRSSADTDSNVLIHGSYI